MAAVGNTVFRKGVPVMNRQKIIRFLCSVGMFGFLLGIHNGKIALWKDNKPDPIKVFPYSASTLPLAEQERLKQGIPIESLEELHRLAEAYLS